jgi:hypothetical protein
MAPLSAPDVLAIWERGRARHAIDRALLLFAAACPEVPPDRLADLPVGQRNAALLRLRHSTFGPEVPAYIDCPVCNERMELALQTDMFLPPPGPTDDGDEFETDGFRFRRPTSRDLCAVLGHADEESATVHLLERCCVSRPDDPSAPPLQGLLAKIEAGLESLDPGADIELHLTCDNCEHAWAAPFDIAAVLWDEVEARARALLGAVHTLACAYGWSQGEVLALTEQRRSAYLGMVMV